MESRIVDAGVTVPDRLEHELFVASPLTTAVAELDFAAYTASPEVISLHSDGRWPLDGYTLADNATLLAQHQADHEQHRAFAFVLLDPTLTSGLGCVYLNPLRDYLHRVGAGPHLLADLPAASAMVTFWLHQEQQDTGLAEAVTEAVDGWLRDEWPLDTWMFRVLPGERSSRAALERLDLQRVEPALPGETRPYLWYQPRVCRRAPATGC